MGPCWAFFRCRFSRKILAPKDEKSQALKPFLVVFFDSWNVVLEWCGVVWCYVVLDTKAAFCLPTIVSGKLFSKCLWILRHGCLWQRDLNTFKCWDRSSPPLATDTSSRGFFLCLRVPYNARGTLFPVERADRKENQQINNLYLVSPLPAKCYCCLWETIQNG